jgi:hypothetical protein
MISTLMLTLLVQESEGRAAALGAESADERRGGP